MKDIYKVLLIAFLSRIIMFVVSTICNHLFTYVNANYMDVTSINSFPFIGQFDRWDSNIYIIIAHYGYPSGYPDVNTYFPQYAHSQFVPTLARAEWAFFPLYPMTVKVGAFLFAPFLSTTYSLMLSGFIISNTAFFVSVVFFYRLTQRLLKNSQVAVISTIFYAFCGGTVFMSAIFTEALFMALTLGSFYCLEEKKLDIATILGLFASLTRSDGFLIFIPFAIAAVLEFRENKKQSFKLLLASTIVASGYLSFNIVGYFQAGHVFPIQIIAHNLNWGVYPPITEQIYTLGSVTTPSISRPNIFQAFYIISIALMCLPTVYFFIKTRIVFTLEEETVKYWAFYAAMLCVIFMMSYLFSTIRYAIPLLPLYWVSAKIYNGNRSYGRVLLFLTISLSIIDAYLFEISTPYFL
jgi:hypothetical protein